MTSIHVDFARDRLFLGGLSSAQVLVRREVKVEGILDLCNYTKQLRASSSRISWEVMIMKPLEI